ncbi:MAG: DUF1844 domain-containing protein [Verrucomicrobia bacterium]|nr:DUF1844 domain-containing protein [Verrucomicrobiota bacterium]
MNDAPPTDAGLAHASREELLAALFASMVMQQTNMALIFLGKAPHPESGQLVQDLDAAQMFIDQLEMLEVKTKGNLSAQEDKLLKQGLMTVRMAFVHASEHPTAQAQAAAPPPSAAAQPEGAASASPPPADAAAEESRKKFTKKY